MNIKSNASSAFYCDSTLHQCIYDFIDALDNENTTEVSKKSFNILLVYDKREGNDTLICLVVQPGYSFQSEFDDSMIVSYSVIHDWLIRLNLTPNVFDKYKNSFTFVNPNQLPQYQKHYDGSFDPILWQYHFQNDSLIFDKKVYL